MSTLFQTIYREKLNGLLADNQFQNEEDTNMNVTTASIQPAINQQSRVYVAQQDEPRVEVITITPAMAKAWIESTGDKNFRKTTLRRAETIADDIIKGRWDLNYETIKINDGIVEDGLHRLHACVIANRPIQSLVIFGVKPEALRSVDRGKARTLAQELTHEGVPNSARCASITSHWLSATKDVWHTHAGSSLSSASESLGFFHKRKSVIMDAARMVERRKPLLGAANVIGAVICEGTRDKFRLPHFSLTAEKFLLELSSGMSEHTIGNPAILLRNRLIENSRKQNKMSQIPKRALVIHAWNLYCSGEVVNTLKYVLVGPQARKFPTIEQAVV